MYGYERFIKSVTVGSSDTLPEAMTESEAESLLEEIVSGMKGATKVSRGFETRFYYLYIAKFPKIHVAIDNRSGTERKFSIYSSEEYRKVKKYINFV